MSKRNVLGSFLLAVIVTVVLSDYASAQFLTTRADVWAVDPNGPPVGGAGPPLPHVDTITSNGKTFTNNWGGGVLPSGAGPGSLSKTIVAAQVTTMKNGQNYTPIEAANGEEIIKILTGVARIQPGFVADFDPSVNGGVVSRALYLTVPAGTFDANDPSTWGIPAVGAIVGDAEYKLSSRVPIGFNNGDPVSFAALDVNESSLDSQAFNEQTQGRFLFEEDSPTNATPLMGNDFITTTPWLPGPQINPGAVGPIAPGIEGFFATTADVLEVQGISTLLLDATDLAILNNIATWGFGSAFATGLGAGPVSNYDPVFASGFNINGDFRATDDQNQRPGTFIPEPGSFAIWGLIGVSVVAFYRRRSSKRSVV